MPAIIFDFKSIKGSLLGDDWWQPAEKPKKTFSDLLQPPAPSGEPMSGTMLRLRNVPGDMRWARKPARKKKEPAPEIIPDVEVKEPLTIEKLLAMDDKAFGEFVDNVEKRGVMNRLMGWLDSDEINLDMPEDDVC